MSDFNFEGKYARYANFLRNEIDNKEHPFKIFNRLIDVYMFSALYGVLHGVHEECNPFEVPEDHQIEVATIKENTIIKDSFYPKLRFIVTLSQSIDDYTFEEKVDNALRYDYPGVERSMYAHNTDIINQYMYGGLSRIYSEMHNMRSIEDVVEYLHNDMLVFAEECNLDSVDNDE